MGAVIKVTKDESGVRIYVDRDWLLVKEKLLRIDLEVCIHRLLSGNLHISNDISELLPVTEPYLCFIDGCKRFL